MFQDVLLQKASSDGNPQGDYDLNLIQKKLENIHKVQKSQKPEGDDDKGAPKWKQNLQKAKDVGVQAQTPEYQQFMLTHKPDSVEGKKYSQLTRREDQRAFRQHWAETQYHIHIQEKSLSKSWQKVDTTKGTYYPFPRIVQEEGGKEDPENVKAAMNYCRKCMELGGDWVSINQMTERLEFLHLKREHKDIFSQCWELRSTWRAPSTGVGTGPNAPAGSNPKAIKSGAKAKAKAKAEAEPKASEGDTPLTPEQEAEAEEKETTEANKKKEKTQLQIATVEATKLKNKYHTILSSAKCLVEQMTSQSEWAWANNEQNKGALQKAIKEVQDSLTPFGNQFLAGQEVADLKKELGVYQLVVSCKEFTDNTEPKITRLQNIMKAKQAMHKGQK